MLSSACVVVSEPLVEFEPVDESGLLNESELLEGIRPVRRIQLLNESDSFQAMGSDHDFEDLERSALVASEVEGARPEGIEVTLSLRPQIRPLPSALSRRNQRPDTELFLVGCLTCLGRPHPRNWPPLIR
jgi:hypothetical protein